MNFNNISKITNKRHKNQRDLHLKLQKMVTDRTSETLVRKLGK